MLWFAVAYAPVKFLVGRFIDEFSVPPLVFRTSVPFGENAVLRVSLPMCVSCPTRANLFRVRGSLRTMSPHYQPYSFANVNIPVLVHEISHP